MKDAIKLTTYFGERDRAGERLLSDELFDIYGAHGVRSSVLLRGIEGFGRRHDMRTDRLLSLSEDLPAVSIAVDERQRIDAVLAAVLAVAQRGLVTLERARMLDGDLAAVSLPAELREAAKLTVHVGRLERAAGRPAFAAVCELLQRSGLTGATVLLGVDGTRGRRRSRASFFGRNADVPMTIVAVGGGDQIAGVLPQLGALLRDPLATLERVRVCKRDGVLLATPHELPSLDERGLPLWQQLTVHSSGAALAGGRSLHVELIRRLRESDAAGVTAIRGFWGFHGDHAPHGDRLLQLRRHVPVVTIVLDDPARIARSFEIIDGLTAEHGLVTSEMVPALRAIGSRERRGGLELARHRF